MLPYSERRRRILDGISGDVMIVPGARQLTRSNDTEFSFRQSSDFFYLTGFDEPDALLVLAPQHAGHKSILFLRERDRIKEIWNGRRLGSAAAPGALGIDAAYPIEELADRLPEYIVGARTLHYTFGADESRDRTVQAALDAARAKARRDNHAPARFADPAIPIHEMRLFKTDDEIAIMRRAAEATRRGHVAAMRATRPGLHEYEIEATIEYEYARAGAQCPAYESIVGTGENATILHYVTNRDVLKEGDLLLVDSGAEVDCYTCDVTRTWPVNGRFSAEQRAIYEIVLAAQEASIARVHAGAPRNAFHEVSVRVIAEGLIDLGLLKGSADEAIEKETYKDFYMHGTGHWLGLDVHDVGSYLDAEDKPRLLQAGMVTTVEPGIYVQRDLDVDERFKGIGVRIEDDILVTAGGNDNLTQAIPKTIAEIEALVGSAAHAGVA
ncbi:MAG: Xaa-Pro aminopeptidase [Candidatus Eremiobacteraeota bacterium]|nr:Xaa-Pro aminopeptidase [Candidatus Eremiobacteraeota bacterium]